MRPQPIYGKVGDANTILSYCPECGNLQHVEEHRIDRCGVCLGAPYFDDWGIYDSGKPCLKNIPYSCRNVAGTHVVQRPPLGGTP